MNIKFLKLYNHNFVFWGIKTLYPALSSLFCFCDWRYNPESGCCDSYHVGHMPQINNQKNFFVVVFIVCSKWNKYLDAQ